MLACVLTCQLLNEEKQRGYVTEKSVVVYMSSLHVVSLQSEKQFKDHSSLDFELVVLCLARLSLLLYQ